MWFYISDAKVLKRILLFFFFTFYKIKFMNLKNNHFFLVKEKNHILFDKL